RGGGSEQFTYNNVSNPYPTPDLLSQAMLVVVTAGSSYTRALPYGTVEVFNQADSSGNIYLTQVIDPQGNTVNMQYNATYLPGQARLSTVTDAIGQVSTLA